MSSSVFCTPLADVQDFDSQIAARKATASVPTIFDVGMNNGDDSAYYLSRGYRVIGVEANPTLVERARQRFRSELDSGQMVIEPVGIFESPGIHMFWVNEEKSVFSSFDRNRASRGMKCRPIAVECITFGSLLRKYGTPHFLKLDVEGVEAHCLQCLQDVGLPQYISVEAECFDHLLLLWGLGYREFKIVDQMRHNSKLPDFSNNSSLSRLAKRACRYADRFKNRVADVTFPRGCSGPFGEDTPGEWQTVEQVAYNWLHLRFAHTNRGSLTPDSWYDFHARAPKATSPKDEQPLALIAETHQARRLLSHAHRRKTRKMGERGISVR